MTTFEHLRRMPAISFTRFFASLEDLSCDRKTEKQDSRKTALQEAGRNFFSLQFLPDSEQRKNHSSTRNQKTSQTRQ